MIEGGCNCGAIRYKIDAKPVVVAQCHCKNCQRQSGSAFSVNLMVPAAAVTTSGELTTYTDTDTASGNPVYRRFCGTCGSPIFSDLAQGGGMTIVKAGTLDDTSILTIQAAWGDPDQPAPLVHASAQAVVADNTQAAALGEQVAAQLRQGGAR